MSLTIKQVMDEQNARMDATFARFEGSFVQTTEIKSMDVLSAEFRKLREDIRYGLMLRTIVTCYVVALLSCMLLFL